MKVHNKFGDEPKKRKRRTKKSIEKSQSNNSILELNKKIKQKTFMPNILVNKNLQDLLEEKEKINFGDFLEKSDAEL